MVPRLATSSPVAQSCRHLGEVLAEPTTLSSTPSYADEMVVPVMGNTNLFMQSFCIIRPATLIPTLVHRIAKAGQARNKQRLHLIVVARNNPARLTSPHPHFFKMQRIVHFYKAPLRQRPPNHSNKSNLLRNNKEMLRHPMDGKRTCRRKFSPCRASPKGGFLFALECAGKCSKRRWPTYFGADAVAGMHNTTPVMYTEEYQVDYYKENLKAFDEFPCVVGEQVWNFADFATSQSLLRVEGNKKGLFTRDRKPKLAAHWFRQRWHEIPDFGYKA